MRSPEQVHQLEPLVDYLGFIFYEKSKRYVDETPSVGNAKKVGVFVNATLEEIQNAIASHSLDVIQLHGDETPEFCAQLRSKVQIIKAFGVGFNFSFHTTTPYEGIADFFLFDTHTAGYGGSGKQFDWTLLSKYRGTTPFILSGGIHPHSVASIRAIRHPKFHGIDLNSGFEFAPANKNVALLSTFIHQIKHAQ